MAKENIYFTNDYRVLENGNSIIIGNIINGQWFKCQKGAFDFLKDSMEQELSIEEILEKCEDEYTKKYILKVIQLLEEVGAVSNDEVHKKIENDIAATDVSLVLTNGCNLRCRHCVASCGDFKRQDLSFEKIKRVTQWCNKKKIKEITLTGGEIFIRKDIKEILQYIRENYKGKISVITNGTLISDTILDTLVRCVDQIDISMDGYDDESVSKIRGNGVFDKVVDVIKRLHHKGFKAVSLSMVLTGENRKHVEEFKSLCAKYEVQELLRVLSPGGRAADNFDELKDIDFEKEETETSNVSEYTFKCVCQKLNSELSIDEKGNVYPCVLLQDRGKEIGTIEDLEKGYLNQVTDKEPIVDMIDGCKQCNVRYFCASNCVGLDLAIFNNAKAKQMHCDKMKKIYDAVWN